MNRLSQLILLIRHVRSLVRRIHSCSGNILKRILHVTVYLLKYSPLKHALCWNSFFFNVQCLTFNNHCLFHLISVTSLLKLMKYILSTRPGAPLQATFILSLNLNQRSHWTNFDNSPKVPLKSMYMVNVTPNNGG